MHRQPPHPPHDKYHIRAHVLERRKELRRKRKDQKDEEYRRRARVARFLTDIDDLREALRVRQLACAISFFFLCPLEKNRGCFLYEIGVLFTYIV